LVYNKFLDSLVSPQLINHFNEFLDPENIVFGTTMIALVWIQIVLDLEKDADLAKDAKKIRCTCTWAQLERLAQCWKN
jgi:hypothetical protein